MHCENDVWTVESLCGLAKGVPVGRFYQVKNEIYQGLISDLEELKKVGEAGQLLDEFYAYVQEKEGMSVTIRHLGQPETTKKKKKLKKRKSSKNKPKSQLHFQQGDLFGCENEFLKWLAQGKIPLSGSFVGSLPKNLKIMYDDATPISATLRTKSRFTKEYHRALYLSREANREFVKLFITRRYLSK